MTSVFGKSLGEEGPNGNSRELRKCSRGPGLHRHFLLYHRDKTRGSPCRDSLRGQPNLPKSAGLRRRTFIPTKPSHLGCAEKEDVYFNQIFSLWLNWEGGHLFQRNLSTLAELGRRFVPSKHSQLGWAGKEDVYSNQIFSPWLC